MSGLIGPSSLVLCREWTPVYVCLKLGAAPLSSSSRDAVSASPALEGEDVIWLGETLGSADGGRGNLIFRGFGRRE